MYLVNYLNQEQIDIRIMAGETGLIPERAWDLSNTKYIGGDVGIIYNNDNNIDEVLASDGSLVSKKLLIWKEKTSEVLSTSNGPIEGYTILPKAEIFKINELPSPEVMITARDAYNVLDWEHAVIMVQTGEFIMDEETALNVLIEGFDTIKKEGKRIILQKQFETIGIDILNNLNVAYGFESWPFIYRTINKFEGTDPKAFKQFFEGELAEYFAEKEATEKNYESQKAAKIAADINEIKERGFDDEEAEIIYYSDSKFNGEKEVWAKRHGSKCLKKGLEGGYNMNRIYHEERFSYEVCFSGSLSNDGFSQASNPSLVALNAAEFLSKDLGKGYNVSVVWNNDGEAIEVYADWAKCYYILNEIPKIKELK